MSGKYVMYYPVSKVEVNLECIDAGLLFINVQDREQDIVFIPLM